MKDVLNKLKKDFNMIKKDLNQQGIKVLKLFQEQSKILTSKTNLQKTKQDLIKLAHDTTTKLEPTLNTLIKNITKYTKKLNVNLNLLEKNIKTSRDSLIKKTSKMKSNNNIKPKLQRRRITKKPKIKKSKV